MENGLVPVKLLCLRSREVKKKILGICLVFLFFVAAFGFSQTIWNCQELIWEGANLTRLVRTVEVFEESWGTGMNFYLSDGRELHVEWNNSTRSNAPQGNNFEAVINIAWWNRSTQRYTGYQNVRAYVAWIPGRMYGVVVGGSPSGAGSVASFRITR
jgi:hypothetical protein